MRKKFVLFILVPFLLFCTALYLFADRWIESAFEAAGESVVGARVEIDDLRLSLSPIAIEFARLQVASPKDPWKNMLETGKVRFALNFGQLLRNKTVNRWLVTEGAPKGRGIAVRHRTGDRGDRARSGENPRPRPGQAEKGPEA